MKPAKTQQVRTGAHKGNDNGRPDWARVVDKVCELSVLAQKPGGKRSTKPGRAGPPTLARAALVAGLKTMEPALRQVAADGEAMGLEPEVLNHLHPHILAQADQLAALA